MSESQARIGDETGKALAHALRTNRTLSLLNLEDNRGLGPESGEVTRRHSPRRARAFRLLQSRLRASILSPWRDMVPIS